MAILIIFYRYEIGRGVWNFPNIDRKNHIFVDDEVMITATLFKLESNELTCVREAKLGAYFIITGSTR